MSLQTDEKNSTHINHLILRKKRSRSFLKVLEKLIPSFLFMITSVSIFTTIGIIFTLLSETIEFFKRVSFLEFFTGTVLKPLSQNPEFGIVPLMVGTISSATIA